MRTKYFTYFEFIRSDVADKYSIKNYPSVDNEFYNIGKLSVILDQLRHYIGCPLFINSGYRCPELNKAVGGANNSNHLKGLAADITTRLRSIDVKLYEYIKANKSYYNINEVILYDTFIHVSIY